MLQKQEEAWLKEPLRRREEPDRGGKVGLRTRSTRQAACGAMDKIFVQARAPTFNQMTESLAVAQMRE